MGRALYSNKSKWQYYTMSDKSNAIKLPMSKMEEAALANMDAMN